MECCDCSGDLGHAHTRTHSERPSGTRFNLAGRHKVAVFFVSVASITWAGAEIHSHCFSTRNTIGPFLRERINWPSFSPPPRARSTSANFDFGFDFGQFLDVEFVGPEKVGLQKGGGPKGGGPKGGGPELSRFSLPPPFSFFFSLLEFWWCFEDRSPEMCTSSTPIATFLWRKHHRRHPGRQ